MAALTFATRPSRLARWQTNHIIQQLQEKWDGLTCNEVVITTQGDKILDTPLPEIGGKGLFTLELEQALLEGRVDAAVHSLKDLPTDNTPGLTIGVIPLRAEVVDCLISPAGHTLEDLPSGAVVGTSSLRRQAQILAHRPDLTVQSIRGNVETRIRKADDGHYQAVVLAAAGVSRLGLQTHISQHLPVDVMLPAPGQGALAVQCRSEDVDTLRFLAALDHQPTRAAVTAERTLLAALGGGCSLPVGAFAAYHNDELHLQAVVASVDGQQLIHANAHHHDPLVLGQSLAQTLLSMGAAEVLGV
ncbi:MAG: hydroxymethylbilane synthase [Anaerolineae bacterium]|nr:hydroxymethylbilane synthase [Anaerolineae bacterium]